MMARLEFQFLEIHFVGFSFEVQTSVLPGEGGRVPATLPLWLGGRTAPRDVHVLIPGTYKYVSLHGNRDFANVIKLKILR